MKCIKLYIYICMITMSLPEKIPAELWTALFQIPAEQMAALFPSNREVFVNRYSIRKKLGSGKYGTAYLVQDLKSNKEWNVLKLKLVSSLDAGDMKDVVQGAKLLSNLNHPGIVRFKDSFLSEELFCIVTEYCEGGNLHDKINMQRKEQMVFSEFVVLDWFIQLMQGIQYMHKQCVLHRNMNTRNIFLKNNMIKIGDFGSSRIQSNDLANTLIDTPHYMSPELIRCADNNFKSDIWSAGCILYEMCALRQAFSGTSLIVVLSAIVADGTPKLPDAYSDSLTDVLETMLRKDPAKRVSASEVLQIPYIAKHMQATTSATIESEMQYPQLASNRNSNANCYPSGKGFLLIVNNFTKTREGTQKDQENLLTIFRDKLEFDIVVKENVTRYQLMSALCSVKKLLLKGVTQNNELCHYSSFFLAIMSHGNKTGIKTMDGYFVSVEEIMCHFKADTLSTMAGKPKVLLLQACRGPLSQRGVIFKIIQSDGREEEEDAQQSYAMTPMDADVLIAYSTTEGYVSYRNSNTGSWFMHHVTQTLRHYYPAEHLLDMLTMVNQQVAEERTTASKVEPTVMKQMPCLVSTLTKKLYLGEIN